jgi:hypothetical protein
MARDAETVSAYALQFSRVCRWTRRGAGASGGRERDRTGRRARVAVRVAFHRYTYRYPVTRPDPRPVLGGVFENISVRSAHIGTTEQKYGDTGHAPTEHRRDMHSSYRRSGK